MEDSEIYANVDTPSSYHGKRNSSPRCSQGIYANEDTFQTLETTTAEPASTGAVDVLKRYRIAAVFLSLLCVLLLTGLIVSILQHTKHNSELKAVMLQLHISFNNLTKERDQLQTSFNNLAKERDQLQTSFNNLVKEKDQLQTSFNNLVKEKDQLQTSFNNLVKEKDQLQASNSNLAEKQDQLQKSLQDVTQKKDDLFKELKDQMIQQGWVYFSGSFYFKSSLEKSWQNSREDCKSRKADLMIINSKEKQDFARRFKKRMWIGLTDMQTEGTWRWVDGTQLSISFWGPSEPNGDLHQDEDCAEIKNYNSEKSWNDASCQMSISWVCEKTFAL